MSVQTRRVLAALAGAAGIVVGVTPDDYPGDALAGVGFQQTLERRAFAAGGAQVRSLKLTSLAVLDDPGVRALMEQALARRPIDPSGHGRCIVKGVSPNQRRRRA